MGYYWEGLGTNHRARKLKYRDEDGFCGDEKVYDYYCQILGEIRNFFEKNQEKINIINEKINIDFVLDIKKIKNKGNNNNRNINKKKERKENGGQIYSSDENSILTNESEVNKKLLE